jgi:hypothetical protein
MNTRTKILMAIKECSLSPIDCEQMEAYAMMEEWELRDELIGEIYALRDALDELNGIEQLKIKSNDQI